MESLWENHRIAIIAVVALVIAALSSFVVVPETQQAVIVRTGEPVRVANTFDPDERYGQTGAGIIFKGGGFYETDYRSESYKRGAKKESEASKPKESKSGDSSGSGSKADTGASGGGGAAKDE